jgi:hypothetical protein
LLTFTSQHFSSCSSFYGNSYYILCKRYISVSMQVFPAVRQASSILLLLPGWMTLSIHTCLCPGASNLPPLWPYGHNNCSFVFYLHSQLLNPYIKRAELFLNQHVNDGVYFASHTSYSTVARMRNVLACWFGCSASSMTQISG